MGVTPNMFSWSERRKKLQGRSSCVNVPLHLPSARNLHFPSIWSLWSLQPLLFSNKSIVLSTNKNSAIEVMAGLTSSHYAIRMNLHSSFGKGGVILAATGPKTGLE